MTSLDRLWGSNDVDALFHGGDRAVVPWRRAGRLKDQPSGDAAVRELLVSPVRLVEVDPRALYASQTSLIRHHALHYAATDLWERTGLTAADMDQRGNRFPIVAPEEPGRFVIMTGHHRAFVALIEGRPLLARLVGEPGHGPISVTPRLHLTDDVAARLAALGLDDAQIEDRLHVAQGGGTLLSR